MHHFMIVSPLVHYHYAEVIVFECNLSSQMTGPQYPYFLRL